MVAFFIPAAESNEQAERVYEAVCKFHGVAVGENRVRGLSWIHNGQAMSCNVGDAAPAYYRTGDEPVVAIIMRDKVYLVCTENRGVARGEPIYVGENEVQNARYFDPVT